MSRKIKAEIVEVVEAGYQLVKETTTKYEKIPEKKEEKKPEKGPNMILIVLWIYLSAIFILSFKGIMQSPGELQAPATSLYYYPNDGSDVQPLASGN